MPAIFTPIRIDRVQQALFEVFAEATEVDVHWSYGQVPQESLSEAFVSLTMVSGPGPFIRKHRRGTTLQPIDDVLITVGPLVVGKRLGIVLNGFNYFVDVTAMSTVTGVRGQLVGQINDDAIEPVNANAVFPNALRLTAEHLGAIVDLRVYGALTAAAPNLNDNFVHVVEGTRTMLVNVQAYSKQREPYLGAWAVLQQCISALQTEDLVEKLRAFGVGVWGHSLPVDLSRIAGAHWETRSSFDLTLAARARWVRPVDIIETVTGTINSEAFTVVSP